MYQGTTPVLTFEIESFDASAMTAFVSFKYGSEVLTKTGDDVTVTYADDKSTIVCRLTQEETLAMRQGTVKVQARFIDSDNEAYATDEAYVDVEPVLYKEVIHYGG